MYDAGYTNVLINQLVENLRQKLATTKTIPDNTKIFVLDICPDISNLSSFLNQEIVDQDFLSIEKLSIYWFLLSMVSNVGNDIISKYVNLHFFEITFFRFFFASILFMPIILCKKKDMTSFNLPIHLIRGVILLFATASWTYGLSIVPVTTSTVIGSSIPLIILVLSITFLKEKVTWQRWSVIIVGLLGIIITLNPSSSEFDVKTLILLTSALLLAILDIINKRIVKSESMIIMLLYSSIVVASISFIPMLFYWELPSIFDLFLLLILGINSNLVLFFISKAFLLADISALAPSRYFCFRN